MLTKPHEHYNSIDEWRYWNQKRSLARSRSRHRGEAELRNTYSDLSVEIRDPKRLETFGNTQYAVKKKEFVGKCHRVSYSKS